MNGRADRNGLPAYVRAIPPSPGKGFVVHGEEQQSLSLAGAIRDEHPKTKVTVPSTGTVYDL
jgi:predicted metal-dependent RNase